MMCEDQYHARMRASCIAGDKLFAAALGLPAHEAAPKPTASSPAPKAQPPSELRREKYARLIKAGLNARQIGKKLGVTKSAVYHNAAVLGLKIAKSTAKGGSKPHRKLRSQYSALVAEGLTVPQIAQRLGRHTSTVRQTLDRMGLKAAAIRKRRTP